VRSSRRFLSMKSMDRSILSYVSMITLHDGRDAIESYYTTGKRGKS
jgi:hypothetical protein